MDGQHIVLRMEIHMAAYQAWRGILLFLMESSLCGRSLVIVFVASENVAGRRALCCKVLIIAFVK